MRLVWLIIAALLAFVVTLAWRAPASWLGSYLPAELHCTAYEGTLWNGGCNGFALRGTALGRLTWQIDPLALFTARLALHATARSTQIDLRGDVELRTGSRMGVRALSGRLDSRMLRLPLPDSARGSAMLKDVEVSLAAGQLVHLAGEVSLRNLTDSRTGTDLGSYQLQFPLDNADTSPWSGRLRDLDGPVALSATVRITDALGYEVDGSVAPRASADPALARVLDLAGPADADGVRRLSVSGTL